MARGEQVVAGIDVGGPAKGFHAVTLALPWIAAASGRWAGDGGGRGWLSAVRRVETWTSPDPAAVAAWVASRGALVVGVDAPSGWSDAGGSRRCERELALFGRRVHCFATPTRERALACTTGFYDWVFRGEALYRSLATTYPQAEFERGTGVRRRGSVWPCCFETFPQAVACAWSGRILSARDKSVDRRRIVAELGWAAAGFESMDCVDAALCAMAAAAHCLGRGLAFGGPGEGCLWVPDPAWIGGGRPRRGRVKAARRGG